MISTETSQVRRLLYRWGQAGAYCRAKQKELEEFQTLLKSCTELSASTLSGMPKGYDISDPTCKAALKLHAIADNYAEIITNTQNEISDMLRFKTAMDDIIALLKPEQQRILDLRYKQNHKWVYIGLKLNFSEHHAQKLENKAVKYLAGKIKVECI